MRSWENFVDVGFSLSLSLSLSLAFVNHIHCPLITNKTFSLAFLIQRCLPKQFCFFCLPQKFGTQCDPDHKRVINNRGTLIK